MHLLYSYDWKNYKSLCTKVKLVEFVPWAAGSYLVRFALCSVRMEAAGSRFWAPRVEWKQDSKR